MMKLYGVDSEGRTVSVTPCDFDALEGHAVYSVIEEDGYPRSHVMDAFVLATHLAVEGVKLSMTPPTSRAEYQKAGWKWLVQLVDRLDNEPEKCRRIPVLVDVLLAGGNLHPDEAERLNWYQEHLGGRP